MANEQAQTTPDPAASRVGATDQAAPSSPCGAEIGTGGSADPRSPKRPLPAPTTRTTRRTLTLDGEERSYDATVATLTIDTKKVAPAASVFHADFIALPDGEHADPSRPVTFLFNGGPGSATTFLLLGSLGPRRIVTEDPVPPAGAAPATTAPYELIDNPQTLLPQSDLVFIDAPSTGFSQMADEAKPELWSVDGDVAAFAQFIQKWLSANGRWNSPKYVFGESYGTVRGSALSYALLEAGIALNGLVLLSDILDYGHILGSSDQAYIGYLPTYAAIAHHHGRAGGRADLEAHVQEARVFADGALRRALSRGDRLAPGDAAAAAERLGELTGLSRDYVLRSDLRVTDPRFRKELLRDQGQVVGRYDGRVSAYDLDAASDDETFVADDAFLSPAYAALVNAYLRDELGWSGTEERRPFADFDWESVEPGKGWTWSHKLPEHTKTMWGTQLTHPQVIPDLAAAVVRNPRLKVLVANGYFDLATPFFQTEYDIDHLALPAALRANIAFTYYRAGHMVYTSPAALSKLIGDLRRFYEADSAGAMTALDERPALPPLGLDA
ncbi:S10 family peptidase [Schaalia naturae]|uniref:S10 family peptidase n=1 Tax=Schaalia naturae TaxID=635203 RepID=A0ABW2SQ92_9ACTO